MSIGDGRPDWVRHLESKYGLPIEQVPGTVYGLCYDPPVVVRSVSSDYAADPTAHPRRARLPLGRSNPALRRLDPAA